MVYYRAISIGVFKVPGSGLSPIEIPIMRGPLKRNVKEAETLQSIFSKMLIADGAAERISVVQRIHDPERVLAA